MSVLCYHCPEARESNRWLAIIVMPNGTRCPVNFYATTEAVAREHAQAFYDAEIERERAKMAPRKPRAQKVQAEPQPADEYIEDCV